MSNTTLLLDDLSFAGIKSSLRTFLQEQSQFTDYDFEGSNLAALLDVLAYNTQQNGYMLNMIFNESFIDSAQIYDSLLSHAKELNYVPRSVVSSSIIFDVTVTPQNSTPSSITIPANTIFTATAANSSFVFRTVDAYEAFLANDELNAFTVANVIAYEGPIFTDSYTINWNDTTQEFTIQNGNVDTDSVTVIVRTGASNTTYTSATSLLGYDEESQIFFIESTYNKKYKILFGDNIIGKKPENGSTVYISYRVPKGEPANGVSRLRSGSIAGHANVSVTVTANSDGGAARESIESIRYYAPRYFQTRDRAVTVSDYETLLKGNFPEIRALNVYGGEDMNPPQFGKVALSIDLNNADGVSDGRKSIYYDFLRARCPVTVEPIFVDPDFLYVKVVSKATYDPNTALKTPTAIKHLVSQAISTYNDDNLSDFGVTLRLSRLMAAINKANPAILSNQTSLLLQRHLVLDDASVVYSMKFHNAIMPKTLTSTSFSYNAKTCYFDDDGSGAVRVYTFRNGTKRILDANIGTIDYDTGDVEIGSIVISSATGRTVIMVTPKNQDVTTKQNSILEIDTGVSSVTVTS